MLPICLIDVRILALHATLVLWSMALVSFSPLIMDETFAESAIDSDLFSEADWQRIDQANEIALRWLATRQQPDGSFPTSVVGQPGVTSLCVMAFAAHGHLPGQGEYGIHLQAAIDYVVSQQKENGLISLAGPRGRIDPRRVPVRIGVPASYNHAMSSLMLSELFGTGAETTTGDMRQIIEKSIKLTLDMQGWPKARAVDEGGWRYLTNYDQYNADLSVAGWHLMFLRSAKNAGFDVAKEPIQQAVEFVKRCYLPKEKVFTYFPESKHRNHRTHAMQGAGILALAHAGVNYSQEAKDASDWLAKHPFTKHGSIEGNISPHNRYSYGIFLCTLAMHQMGDEYWHDYFPSVVMSLLAGQRQNGSWPDEKQKGDKKYGNCYTTALAVLTLGTLNELLPIFQR